MKVVILAGGLGTRLRPLTNNIPKVMIKIGGKPVLEHLINLCVHHGFPEIILSLFYLPEPVMAYFQDGRQFKAKISYSVESEPMGSAGAFKYSQKLIADDSFIVLNGDVMTNVDLAVMAKFHQEKGGLATFLVHKTDHPFDSDLVRYDETSLIKRFFRPQPGDQFKPFAKTGTHIFQPQVLDFIPESQKYSLEKQLIPDLLSKKEKLYAYCSDCYSKDMGTPERLAQVTKDYQNGKISF